MAGPFDFTGQNIEDSYQRVLQTDGTSIYDGTGSLFTLPGVSKITAGGGVIVTPSSGVGDVTITSTAAFYNTSTGSYGSFFDTGSYTATSITTIYSMSLSTTDISNGVYVDGGDRTKIYFTNGGVYNIQFSAQFSNSDNAGVDVTIWTRKNDSGSANDIADSAGVVTVPAFKGGQNGQTIGGWNYYITAAAGDYIQLLWVVDVANKVTLETIPAGVSPTHPRVPSLIVTAQRVDTFLSNTGSFSGSFIGSFTGSLLGTSSNAVSSSFASTASSVNPLQQNVFITGSINVSGSINLNGVDLNSLMIAYSIALG